MVITEKEFRGKKTEDFKDPIDMLRFVLKYLIQEMDARKEAINNCRTEQAQNQEEEDEDYEEEAEAEVSPSMQKKKRSGVICNGPNAPADLPAEIRNAIAEQYRGTQIVLVIQKRIFSSDVNRGHNRFSVPVRQVRTQFLTEEEKRKLNSEDISVVLIQPCLESIKMNMKTWVMPKENGKVSSSYMLKTKWGEVVMNNNIKKGDIVQLWAFRTETTDSTLGFALVRVRTAGKKQQHDQESTSGGKADVASSSSSHPQVSARCEFAGDET
ncbi:B3 domain-containing protein At2g31720-like [Dillenia turbinata]|uniref:B3 domain-containing protein At2g31720-like n=1 Tax=Dillenia turbinata TaxID=194707 RepID=A0AAN8Z4B5_9MAGN